MIIACAVAFTACSKSNGSKEDDSQRSVMVLYSAGFNSLSSNLQTNIKEMKQGWLPTKKTGQDVVLIVSKPRNGSYSQQTSPYLIRMYKKDTQVVMDTIRTYPVGKRLIDTEMFRTIMMDVKSLYPAKSYGMVFSSHATGWLPTGYYANPEYYENLPVQGRFGKRTIGQEVYIEGGSTKSDEMEVEELASAIPYKLDYLLFDACFAGCVEVAYALKDKTALVGFSQAEVLTDGFDYTTMVRRILKEKDPAKVCEDYISLYELKTGDLRSATISAIHTSGLGNLASVCKTLCNKYRDQISTLDWKKVQPFFGGEQYWFFDLEDIFLQAGITAEEKASLESALNACVAYKGTTGQYYSATDARTHKVNVFSGFTMYLPSVPGDYLRDFYKGLSWNKAVGLVE